MGCSLSQHNLNNTVDPSTAPPAAASARTFSLVTPLVHHPPLKKGDTHHLVSLTSTSYGSLDSTHQPQPTLCSSSSMSDSVINTWELMAGLDDLDSYVIMQNHGEDHAKASAVLVAEEPPPCPSPNTNQENFTKPLWQHLSQELLLSQMDSSVGSSFRRALWSRHLVRDSYSNPYHVKVGNMEPKTRQHDRIVIYYTSLRGIQRTYEDCCMVRTIFKGFRVAVDERDVSMDSSYRKEVQSALSLDDLGGGKYKKKMSTGVVSLPQVFIGGKYVGGAEEIKQLHEVGELAKLLRGFPVGDHNPGFVCGRCGDARFLPCFNCNGSRKVFHEQLKICPDCNENGLVRCPDCCI